MTDRKLGKGALALISALAVAAPVAMVATPASAYVFSNVRIEGNQRIEPATILSYLDLPRGQDVSAGALNDAMQRLQNSGLFETVELVPSGGTLVVRVAEYPTINTVAFEGNRRLKDENLAEIVKSQSRRVYSPPRPRPMPPRSARSMPRRGAWPPVSIRASSAAAATRSIWSSRSARAT